MGLTQEELSRRCDLHLTAISKLERGDSLPGIETIVKLADILELDPSDLCAGIHWAEKERCFEVEDRSSADHRRAP
jgi:transcriptional regulator with XRE-family HTH domain